MAKENSKPAKKQDSKEQVNSEEVDQQENKVTSANDSQENKVTYANDPQTEITKKEEKGMSYDVKFSSFPAEGSVKGVCSVVFGGEIAVKGVKVIEGSKGLFVSMPSYKAGDEYKDIVYPITKEGRQKLNDAVISEYNTQVQAHQEAFVQNNGIGFDMAAPTGTPMNAPAPAMQ